MTHRVEIKCQTDSDIVAAVVVMCALNFRLGGLLEDVHCQE